MSKKLFLIISLSFFILFFVTFSVKAGYVIQEKSAKLSSPQADMSCAEDSSTHKIYCFGGGAPAALFDVIFEFAIVPDCTFLSCEGANPSLPCSCGTAIADAVNPWCCAGNNAVYNSKATCQVGACTPPLLHLLVPVGLCLAEENAMTRTLLILMNQNPANFVIYL